MINRQIRNIAVAGIFSALSIVLVLLIHFPIFPAVSFLEYDPADITIYLMTAVLGPWYGLGMTVVVSVIQGLTVSSGSGWVGVFMHIAATGSFVAAESVVLYFIKKRIVHKNNDHYQKNERSEKSQKSKKSVGMIFSFPQIVLAVGGGVVAMTLIMALWNLILTPYFMGAPLKDVLLLYPFIVGFNLVKGLINGCVTVILYKSLSRVFERFYVS